LEEREEGEKEELALVSTPSSNKLGVARVGMPIPVPHFFSFSLLSSRTHGHGPWLFFSFEDTRHTESSP